MVDVALRFAQRDAWCRICDTIVKRDAEKAFFKGKYKNLVVICPQCVEKMFSMQYADKFVKTKLEVVDSETRLVRFSFTVDPTK